MQDITAISSVVVLMVAAGLMWRRIRAHQTMVRLQEALDEVVRREIARQERKRQEWWTRNLSPAVAMARVEQQRSYRFPSR